MNIEDLDSRLAEVENVSEILARRTKRLRNSVNILWVLVLLCAFASFILPLFKS